MSISKWSFACVVVGLPLMAMGCFASDAAEGPEDEPSVSDNGITWATGQRFEFTSSAGGVISKWSVEGKTGKGAYGETLHSIAGSATCSSAGAQCSVTLQWSSREYRQSVSKRVRDSSASGGWRNSNSGFQNYIKSGDKYTLAATDLSKNKEMQDILREFASDFASEVKDGDVDNVPDLRRRSLSAQKCILTTIWFGSSAVGTALGCLGAETGAGAVICGTGLVTVGKNAVAFANDCF